MILCTTNLWMRGAGAWKEGGMVSAKVLHALLNKIWNEEDIPQDWKVGLLVTLPKKGDLYLRKNWRGITLLTVASKVLCKIILERMKDALDIRALRCAFR